MTTSNLPPLKHAIFLLRNSPNFEKFRQIALTIKEAKVFEVDNLPDFVISNPVAAILYGGLTFAYLELWNDYLQVSTEEALDLLSKKFREVEGDSFVEAIDALAKTTASIDLGEEITPDEQIPLEDLSIAFGMIVFVENNLFVEAAGIVAALEEYEHELKALFLENPQPIYDAVRTLGYAFGQYLGKHTDMDPTDKNHMYIIKNTLREIALQALSDDNPLVDQFLTDGLLSVRNLQ